MTALSIFRGDTVNIDLTITDSDGSALNITGYKFFFTAKSNDDDNDDDALIKKDVTTHLKPDGSDGTLTGQSRITLSKTQTAVAIGNHYYDIQMKDSSDDITTLTKDRFNVKQDVTTRES